MTDKIEWGILDDTTIVFVEWVGNVLVGVSDGDETISVCKSRVTW